MASTASDLDPSLKNVDDAGLDKIPYRQLQQIAMSMQIPGNLKRGLMVILIKARREGKEKLIQQELGELQEKRQKRKKQKQSDSNNTEAQTRRNEEAPPSYARHFQNYGPVPPVSYGLPLQPTSTPIYPQLDARGWQPLNLSTSWPSSNNNRQEQERYPTHRNIENTSTRGLPIPPYKPPYHGGKPYSWMSYMAQQNQRHFSTNPYFLPHVSNPPGQRLEDSNINPTMKFLSDIGRACPQYPKAPNHMYVPPLHGEGSTTQSHVFVPNFQAEISKIPSCVYAPHRHGEAVNTPNLDYRSQSHSEATNTPSRVYTPQCHGEATNTPSRVYTPQCHGEATNTPSRVYTPQCHGEATNTPSRVYTPQCHGEATNIPSLVHTSQRHREATNTPSRVYTPQRQNEAANTPNLVYTPQCHSETTNTPSLVHTSQLQAEATDGLRQMYAPQHHGEAIHQHTLQQDSNNRYANVHPSTSNYSSNPEQFRLTGQHRANITEVNNSLTKNNVMPNFTQTRPSDVSNIIWAQQQQQGRRRSNWNENLLHHQPNNQSNIRPEQISGRITGTSEGSITSNPLARNNFGSLSSTSLQQQNQALGLITNPLQEIITPDTNEVNISSTNKFPQRQQIISPCPKRINDYVDLTTNSSEQETNITCINKNPSESTLNPSTSDLREQISGLGQSIPEDVNSSSVNYKIQSQAKHVLCYTPKPQQNNMALQQVTYTNTHDIVLTSTANSQKQIETKVKIDEEVDFNLIYQNIFTNNTLENIFQSSLSETAPLMTLLPTEISEFIHENEPDSPEVQVLPLPSPTDDFPDMHTSQNVTNEPSFSSNNVNQPICTTSHSPQHQNIKSTSNRQTQAISNARNLMNTPNEQAIPTSGLTRRTHQVPSTSQGNKQFNQAMKETNQVTPSNISFPYPSKQKDTKQKDYNEHEDVYGILSEVNKSFRNNTDFDFERDEMTGEILRLSTPSSSSSVDYQKTRNNTSESALQNPLHQQRMYQQPSTSRGLFSTLGQKNTTEKNEANGNKTNYTTYDSFEIDPHPPIGNRVPSLSDEDDLMIVEPETEDLFG